MAGRRGQTGSPVALCISYRAIDDFRVVWQAEHPSAGDTFSNPVKVVVQRQEGYDGYGAANTPVRMAALRSGSRS